MGSSYDGPEALIEEELAGVEEAREDALEVAQEADAPAQARAEVAEAVSPRSPLRTSGRKLHTHTSIPRIQGDVG